MTSWKCIEKKLRTPALIIAVGFLLSACATGGSTVAPKGVAVKVLRPVTMVQGNTCNAVNLIWIDQERVISSEGIFLSGVERSQLAEKARSVVNETGFLQSTSLPPESDSVRYHTMLIKLINMDIDQAQTAAHATKTGRIELSIALKEGGELSGFTECYSTDFSKEIVRRVPKYKHSQLPSDFDMKKMLIARAIRSVLRKFTPARVSTFRPVYGGLGEAAKVSDLLNGGNCKLAFKVALTALKDNETDQSMLFNAGVAAECLAGKSRKQLEKIKALKKSLEFYEKVLMASPSDKEANRAAKEVAQTLELYGDAASNQSDSRIKLQKLEQEYSTPSGF
ncbi:MAG: hypothetical protein HQL54_06510 [Magnetococcales bacterium]|nr:hypothetical protein [Magnetococcales bacterium]